MFGAGGQSQRGHQRPEAGHVWTWQPMTAIPAGPAPGTTPPIPQGSDQIAHTMQDPMAVPGGPQTWHWLWHRAALTAGHF